MILLIKKGFIVKKSPSHTSSWEPSFFYPEGTTGNQFSANSSGVCLYIQYVNKCMYMDIHTYTLSSINHGN